jgi:hypothetical protein
MPVWSITITAGKTSSDPATFVAVNQPNAPVGTLYADVGDAVSWNNTTKVDHEPSLVAGHKVTPGHQTIAWIVSGSAGTNVAYTCLCHPEEKGTIVITQPA